MVFETEALVGEMKTISQDFGTIRDGKLNGVTASSRNKRRIQDIQWMII
jgi:hypothetical protein